MVLCCGGEGMCLDCKGIGVKAVGVEVVVIGRKYCFFPYRMHLQHMFTYIRLVGEKTIGAAMQGEFL